MAQPRPSREVWMRLRSNTALASAMEYNEDSDRTLARKCGLAPAVIQHLRSGRRQTCYPSTAKAIETALHLPPGVLFEFKVAAAHRAA